MNASGSRAPFHGRTSRLPWISLNRACCITAYRPGAGQIPNSDAEFSRASIAERRAAGYHDLKAAIAETPWLRQQLPAHLGAVVHRVKNCHVTTLPEPNLRSSTDADASAVA